MKSMSANEAGTKINSNFVCGAMKTILFGLIDILLWSTRVSRAFAISFSFSLDINHLFIPHHHYFYTQMWFWCMYYYAIHNLRVKDLEKENVLMNKGKRKWIHLNVTQIELDNEEEEYA